MKHRSLYIIMCIFSLLAFISCRDEEAVQSAEGKRTITVNLGIAMSRVTEEKNIGDGSTPKDMKVWIFNQDNTGLIDYYEIENPTFSGSDALNELVNTYERIIELENEVTALNFYVVLNSGNAQGLSPVLDENSMPDQIKAAFFTGLQNVTADNEVPAYGCEENFDVSGHKSSYFVPTINVTRAVGKLELFFTKENESPELMIKEVTLTKLPDKGYLVKPATYSLDYPDESRTLFKSEEEKGTEITAVLTETDASLGDFSQYQDDATKLQSLMFAYLLENPDGGKWAGTENDGNLDYTYPENLTNVTDNRYVMTVSYAIGGTDKTQVVYLPAIERNVWNKVFARVKGGKLQIQYRALPWNKVESSIGYAPQPMTDNPFSNEDEYTNFIKSGESKYILLPLESYRVEKEDGKEYDYSNTQKLFNHLYENPEVGDNEARLCIITRPTYDDKVDGSHHWALKTGSAGARYYFMLTGPKGATWEAHLNDPDGNFAFSTSINDDDFADCTDEGFAKKVRMVTHGIAREQPYIIQIIATHLYTGYEDDPRMSGVSDKDTEPRFDSKAYENLKLGEEKEKWAPYFKDEYLTTWGEDKWKKEEVVDAEFYITVKLADGAEYELTINPPYSPKKDDEKKKYPFYNKETRTYHRFAGTDTRIWIRQVRAQYDWPNLEYLARDLKNDIVGKNEEYNKAYWWTVNPYWNPEHDETVWKKD